jgi:ADP-heptose:LPS heptosyltransferase
LLIKLPLFYEAFFHLAGRRPKRSKAAGRVPQNILVLQLADMGDVLLSSPFLRELRRLRPDAWIGLVVQPAMVSLVERCPYVDEVIPFRWRSFKDWGNSFSGHPRWWFQAARLTVQRLWPHHIDLAISLRWNNDAPQAAALTLMYTSGSPERVGYRDVPHDRLPYRVTDINRLLTSGPVRSYLKHEVEMQLEILSALGAGPTADHVEIWTSQEDEDFARDTLNRTGFSATSPLIAIAPGAAWPFRRWPEERFIALGRWLQEAYGANIAILAAPAELALARRIENGLTKGQTVNLGGRTTIMQMAAVLRRCRLFIGNDSGPIHLAAGVGVPVVGFYGPGEYERFRPWGVIHTAIRVGLPCSPCSQECVFGDPRCIRGISLEQAKEVIARKLATFGQLPRQE